MSIASFVGQSIRDWRGCGLSFALANYRQRWGRGHAGFWLNGRRLTIRARNSDFWTFRQVFRDQEYAVSVPALRERMTARYAAILASGKIPVIVDAGANVGAATLWFADQFRSSAIVAVEPDPANTAILRRNLAAVPQAIILEAAIGAQSGFAALTATDDGWATQTSRADCGVAIVTVAQAAAHVPNGVLFVVKVDIEGFEADLFADNLDWLDEVCAVFVEPHDWMFPERKTSRTFQRAFASRDFDLVLVGENILFVRSAADEPTLPNASTDCTA